MDYTLPIALITAVSGILWVLDRWVWGARTPSFIRRHGAAAEVA